MGDMRFMGVLLLAALPAFSQATTATLLGRVIAEDGNPVRNAKVTAVELNTGVNRSTRTNPSGNYTLPGLMPGNYSVTVQSPGFQMERRQEIPLSVNSTTRVDLQLLIVDERVIFPGAPPPLRTDRADTGAHLEAVQATNLPLHAARNYQTLLDLVPGTTRDASLHSDLFNAAGSLQTEVHGQMRHGNDYLLEGTPNNERTGLLQVLVPPVEAIQEVSVSTSNFETELGRATGAVTSVILKSGGNAVHGAVYEFFRSDAMSARSSFDDVKGRDVQNYFGGNLGGPIRKNRTFFFADVLGIFDHETSPMSGTIPPMAWRAGDLSGGSAVVFDPTTGNLNGTGRVPFAGNLVPANRISATAAGILRLLSVPNQPAQFNNYWTLRPEHKDTIALDAKLDHHFTGGDHLSGHFDFVRPSTFVAPVFGTAGGFGDYEGSGVQNTYSGGLNYQRSFSPTLLAAFRSSAFHYHNDAAIPGIDPGAFASGLSSVFIMGFSGPLAGFFANMPWRRAETNISVATTWTKVAGNHTFKWGADYRRVRDDLLQSQLADPRGSFYFGTAQTSVNSSQARTGPENAFASFLLDLPYFGTRTYVNTFPALRANQLFLYAADKWQVARRLTLDLGLRWEFYPPPAPRFAAGFSNYNPTNNALEVAGIGGVPRNLGIETHYTYFAPRIGAAYRLNWDTVVRAGFGISYTPIPDNTYAYNPPVKQTVQYTTALSGFAPAVTPNGGFLSMTAGFPPQTPPSATSSGTESYVVVPKNWRNPYVENWNVSVQRALPRHFTLDAAYVGDHGVHSVATYNLNVPSDPNLMGLGVNGRPLYRTFGRTADTIAYFNGYSSMYHALQVKVDRRFHNGLLVTTAYTVAKGMGFQSGDDSSLWTYIYPRRSYARNDYDRHQTFVQSYIYDLPFGRGGKWGGWQLTGILTLMTGLPMTIYADASTLNTPGSPQTADQVAPVQKLYGIETPWFTRASFAQPVGVRFGTSGRNTLSGPNFFNADAAVLKRFALTERARFEIRGEALNVTNTPQFSRPVTHLGDPAFGYIESVDGAGRTIQVGAKITF
jgi:hypothetical protein